MSQLLPYETIVKASEGDPEAVAAVLAAGFREYRMIGFSIAFFSEKCSNAFGDWMESGYVLHRKVFTSGRIRGYDRLL